MFGEFSTSRPVIVDDDVLLRGLYEALITSVTLASFFSFPMVVSFFEGETPAWKASDTSRMRHAAWPLLKDPDSLIVIQSMIRCVLLARFCAGGLRNSIQTAVGSSTRARMLSSAAAVLFMAAYLSKMTLFQFNAFRIEGPIGGTFALGLDAVAVGLLTIILFTVLSSGRIAEAVGAFLLAPCVLSVSFAVASANYLEVDPAAGPLGNAAFTFSELLDTAGCIAILCGPGLSSSRLPSFFLGPVVVFEQALGLYYFLDSMEQAPQSTLSFAAAYEDEEVQIESLPMHGTPEQLLVALQWIQFIVAVLGVFVYSVRSSPAMKGAVSSTLSGMIQLVGQFSAAPLLEIEAVSSGKDSETYKPTFDHV